VSKTPTKGYTPQRATVSLPRPAGSAQGGTVKTNAPTKTMAHAASHGKTFIAEPSETHGVRGGAAVSGKLKSQ
jgi:hypothetical protein